MHLEVATIRQLTAIQPSQWQGLLVGGRPFYIRYRWGQLSISLGPVGGGFDSAVGGERWFEAEVGEKMGCMLTLEEVQTFSGLRIPSELI